MIVFLDPRFYNYSNKNTYKTIINLNTKITNNLRYFIIYLYII